MSLPEWTNSLRQDESRLSFLDLAIEIREQIYDASLVDARCSIIDCHSDVSQHHDGLSLKALSLCRQTRAEVAKVCSRKTFEGHASLTTYRRLHIINYEVMERTELPIARSVPPALAMYITSLAYTVRCGQLWGDPLCLVSLHVHLHYWIVRIAKQIRDVFPASRNVTFVLLHDTSNVDLVNERSDEKIEELGKASESAKVAVYEHVTNFWRNTHRLHWGDVPDWVELKFEPRYIETHTVLPRVVVDLGEIWEMLKKERGAERE
ncbi:hypothetical protein BU16DRAFT_564128 [Lophium mytilinum]|uniref:Uncharacterized protein n=1 Tax=Lophium mytilinum TaxID=390894 RepID=A0A6A6QL40_9PEZI|nr:hypothetical protein BU16DRAFT_564128 [Lophium mytilinum]